ncbi:TetR/AcrR family transcriptional regulator [Streptomyces sp. NPDC002680]|uniref:TetR/AcrR family transcriptional regulator n=1 Tax=Streptomyces sp. NPDC002680 TaxID=3364659 RepID=UPI0036AA1F0C
MTTGAGTRRVGQAGRTRELILVAAERLFAERGVHAVANRQISLAAGQGNNAAVSYHFGTKTELIRAIVRRHSAQVERIRAGMLADLRDSADMRELVTCLVRPIPEHLATLGNPSWYARFCVQMMNDPALNVIVVEEAFNSDAMWELLDRLRRCMPELPAEVRAERAAMARHLILHVCAEHERALAENTPTVRSSWEGTAAGLIDAIDAVWRAPTRGG